MPALAVERTFRVLWLVVAAWLAWAGQAANIDFDDGYSAVVNSQYLLGLGEGYFWQRGPALAVFLMPAEWLARAFALPVFDVRVHHAWMGALHLAHLWVCWRLLVACHGARPAVLLAFVACLLTPVFFSYAPFLSHDIFPGALLLAMLVLAVRSFEAGGGARWTGLVVLGAVLPLVKQTYALAWMAIGVSLGLVHLLASDRTARAQGWSRIGTLALAACLSGLLSFVAYAAVSSASLAHLPFWTRPLEIASLVSAHYDEEGGAAAVMYPWIYLRNASAYGLVAVAALLPGLLLSWRGTRLQRVAATTLLLLLVAMQAIPFKEVRYLVYLAPLAAFVTVPVFAFVWEGLPRWRWAALATLAAGLASGLPEAARLRHPFYRDTVLQFLAPLPSSAGFAGRIHVERPLSFVAPEPGAYFGDRYHRITHVSPDHLRLRHGYTRQQWRPIPSTYDLRQEAIAPGDFLVMANDIAVRKPPFRAGNWSGLQPGFLEAVAVAEEVEFVREGSDYVATGRREAAFLVPGAGRSPPPPMIVQGRFAAGPVDALLGVGPAAPSRLRVRAFRLLSWCQPEGCRTAGP